ncbi:MAG: hypothetical protein LBC55_06345 [Desulfovibrio sp.]|jgi:hypothetical protein|nr:hypothetical protein [Desulfovibrio sp.]
MSISGSNSDTVPLKTGVEFMVIKALLEDAGLSIMGEGSASGKRRAQMAAMRAIASPLLDGHSLGDARSVLINITGNAAPSELNEIVGIIREAADASVHIVPGVVPCDALGDTLRVTVYAIGIDAKMKGVSVQPEDEISAAGRAAPIHRRDGFLFFSEDELDPTEPPPLFTGTYGASRHSPAAWPLKTKDMLNKQSRAAKIINFSKGKPDKGEQ